MVEKSTGGSGLHVDCATGLVDASSNAAGLVDAIAEDGAWKLVDASSEAGKLVDAVAEAGAGQPPVETIAPIATNNSIISRLNNIVLFIIF